MDEQLLTITEYSGEGYKPLIDCNGWRVAILRYLDGLYPPAIASMERHLETDEVFILLKGEVTLALGGNGRQASSPEFVPMQPLKLYNVRQNAWHGVLMSRDAVILLVENTDTTAANSQYSPVSPAMLKSYLREAVKMHDWTGLTVD